MCRLRRDRPQGVTCWRYSNTLFWGAEKANLDTLQKRKIPDLVSQNGPRPTWAKPVATHSTILVKTCCRRTCHQRAGAVQGSLSKGMPLELLRVVIGDWLILRVFPGKQGVSRTGALCEKLTDDLDSTPADDCRPSDGVCI